MSSSKPERRLLSWIHLSDIHCGQGDQLEAAIRKDVLRATVRDAAKFIGNESMNLDFGLITGDLFQRGGTDAVEHDELNEFVDNLVAELRLTDGIYCVPGNHDANRGIEEKDPDTLHLLESLRATGASGSVDNALAKRGEAARLMSRFRHYATWLKSKHFNKDATEIAPLSWERIWQFDSTRVRMRGVNSAWLCKDHEDRTRLQIALSSVSRMGVRDNPEEISLIAFHHPLEWCKNQKMMEARVLRDYDVLFTGHIHEADTSSYRSVSKELVHVASGALHDPTRPEKVWDREDNYRYSICSITKDVSGEIAFYQWPRRWRQRHQDFAVDTDITNGSDSYTRWPLREPEKRKTGLTSLGGAPATAAQIIGSVNFDTAIERFGARRTAFPTDRSIAELDKQQLLVPPVFSSAGREDFGVEELAREISNQKHILILGAPGSGKSVALYCLSQQLHAMAIRSIPLRFSDLRRLFASGVGLQRGFSVGEADQSVVVLVDGLDEASVADGIGARTVGLWLEELSRYFTVVLSCRQAEYEMQLAAYVSKISFSHLAHLKLWRAEIEFVDFVQRLVRSKDLQDDSLVPIVKADDNIRYFASRPLFARMLCLVGSEAAKSIESLEDLYIRFFEGLERRTDASLTEAGCYLEMPVGRLWSESAWQSFRLGLLEDEALRYGTLTTVLRRDEREVECISRALSPIIDIGSRVWRQSASYVHYSFYEFLLSSALEERILAERSMSLDRDSIEVLYKDIPRRVRHFLVNRLRKTDAGRGKTQLLDAYRFLRRELALEESRTGCNLIVYILSRVHACFPDLRTLLAGETDLFIRNALFWGLAHSGDMQSTEMFVRSLEESNEHVQMCRGYLLYYHGDLGFESVPPFLDSAPFTPWPRTRSAVVEFMRSDAYAETVSMPRRIIDAYTLMSFALARGEKFDAEEAAIIRGCLDGLVIAPWIRGVLEHRYNETCAR